MPVGTNEQARLVVECHDRAIAADAVNAASGIYEAWCWWRGASRIVWLAPGDDVVYKVEVTRECANEHEVENMRKWRLRGYHWAPEAQLFQVGDRGVVAMPYYAERIASSAEIPDEARRIVPDPNIENFRRRRDGEVMYVDAGDVAVD